MKSMVWRGMGEKKKFHAIKFSNLSKPTSLEFAIKFDYFCPPFGWLFESCIVNYFIPFTTLMLANSNDVALDRL